MIRIYIKKNLAEKAKKRLKSKAVIRKKVKGTQQRPRLTVFRSNRHIYAQLVDDQNQKTLISESALAYKEKAKGVEKALWVGDSIAKKAFKKNIKKAVFDRNGYIYHGRIRAVAEGARKAGLIS